MGKKRSHNGKSYIQIRVTEADAYRIKLATYAYQSCRSVQAYVFVQPRPGAIRKKHLQAT
jgi:hypothetical protein